MRKDKDGKVKDGKVIIEGKTYKVTELRTEKEKRRKLMADIVRRRRLTPKKRQVGTMRLLKAFGTIPGSAQQAGAGRPRGSGKYQRMGFEGVHDYRRHLAKRKVMLQQYKTEQAGRLGKRGLTIEQVQQLREVKAAIQPSTPEVEAPKSVADEELEFRKWMAQTQVSPNTQKILHRLRRTQLKSQSDDVEMQRRLNERRIVDNAGDIMKTPFIFNQHQLDITGVPEKNILMAKNVFKERVENPNLLRTDKLNILQTGEAGNNLRFG
tara:strand:- start:489 stop:1286 length:798 start_codon:yes stop_codon:yes gene_type:complete